MSPDHLTSPQSIGQLLGCSLDGLELKICIYSFFFSRKNLGSPSPVLPLLLRPNPRLGNATKFQLLASPRGRCSRIAISRAAVEAGGAWAAAGG